MKKYILLFVCLLGFGFANAQFTGVGIKAGYTNYKFNDELLAQSAGSFHVGAFTNYGFEFSDMFFVQGGLLFTKKGCLLDKTSPGMLLGNENDIDYTRKYNYRAWYLNVPISVGLRHDFSEDMFIHFNVGPSFNIGLFGDTDIETQGAAHQVHYEGDGVFETFSLMKRFDISAFVSAGFSYKNFFLDFSYDYGFIPVMKDKSTEAKATNGCFMISVGFMLPLNEGNSL